MTELPGVVDYSFNHPTLAQLPSSVKGVARYLRGGGAKQLTLQEAQAIHAAGLFIVVNDELGAGDAANGYAAGEAAGSAAGAAARALGIPTSCVIHPSVDFDVTSDKQMAAVEQYMQGYRETSGYGQGAYGEADVMDALGGMGLLTTGYGWQSSAWSQGRISSHAAMWQYLNGQSMAGGTVDFNRLINQAGLGVWTGEDVGLNEGDLQNIRAYVWGSAPATPGNVAAQAVISAAMSAQPAPTVVITDAQIASLASAVAAALPASGLTVADVQNACSAALAGTPLLADLTLTIGAKP